MLIVLVNYCFSSQFPLEDIFCDLNQAFHVSYKIFIKLFATMEMLHVEFMSLFCHIISDFSDTCYSLIEYEVHMHNDPFIPSLARTDMLIEPPDYSSHLGPASSFSTSSSPL